MDGTQTAGQRRLVPNLRGPRLDGAVLKSDVIGGVTTVLRPIGQGGEPMSLWIKSLDTVTYSDVEAFCVATPRPREGLRLDFKQAIPTELARLIAAFANTSGGMIILGVKGDPKNEPEWPAAGLTLKPGLLEQITQAAQQAIFPPVQLETSPFIVDPIRPGHGVVVVRIHESPEAPHATDGGRKIYERTGDVNQPISFAHVDRIERLLRRRGNTEARRLELRGRFLRRAGNTLPQAGAIRWLSVMPLYPGSPLATLAKCYSTQQFMPVSRQLQRTPEGAFATSHSSLRHEELGKCSLRCASVGVFGDVFIADFCEEEVDLRKSEEASGNLSGRRYVTWEKTLHALAPTMNKAVGVLRTDLGFQGYIQVSVGMLRCAGVRMMRGNDEVGQPFLDDEYSDDEMVMPACALAAADVRPLFDRFQYSFDLLPANSDTFLALS